MTGQLNWFWGGLALGIVFVLAVWAVEPIGVSTQFVILDGIIWSKRTPQLIKEDPGRESGYSSTISYLNKSGGKYAKSIAKPFNYSFVFVVFIIVGAFLSSITKGPKATRSDKTAPEVWRNRFGDSPAVRYLAALTGGGLVLFGARLAGGSTSGHMVSGIMQTSVSGYLFAMAAFAVAIPAAILIYGRK
ncbi:MAG: YeeE/YedE thiosulfate transporter family protein [Deltaproteobacteria bacterium]